MSDPFSVNLPSTVVPVSRKDPAQLKEVSTAENTDQGSAAAEIRQLGAAPKQQPERSELEQTVQDLNGLVQDLQRQVRFSLDDNSGEMIVKVVDRQTDNVIRQIPSEEVLQLREKLEQATGAIFKAEA